MPARARIPGRARPVVVHLVHARVAVQSGASVSLDELRCILVEIWRIASPDWFAELAKQHPTPDAIVEHLARTPRFRLAIGPVPYLPAPLKQALNSVHPVDMVRTLGGRNWLKLQVLGRGGQGEVWLACPCEPTATIDTLVALKFPVHHRISSALQLQKEIQILRRIDSPYVVKLVAEEEPTGTLATRFVNGTSLNVKVERLRRLPVAEAVQIGLDVCDGLQSLHTVYFIHKDVKPGNIVQDAQRAVLIDFGLAEDPLRAPHRLGGTPYYIAPEVFFPESSTKSPDWRADVYSLAATLYHLLAGQPPHFQQCLSPHARTSGARLDLLRFKLADADVECNLADVRRDAPLELCQLLSQALNTNPDRRPDSIKSFRESLEAIKKKFDEALVIEAELWGLAEVLLKVVHDVIKDPPNYTEQQNATAIRNDLELALRRFTALHRLRSTMDNWIGFGAAYAIVPRTVKIHTQVAGHINQLTEFLSVRHQSSMHFPQLLKDLVVRTLEGIRAISVEALAAAHDWRTVLLLFGLNPKPKP